MEGKRRLPRTAGRSSDPALKNYSARRLRQKAGVSQGEPKTGGAQVCGGGIRVVLVSALTADGPEAKLVRAGKDGAPVTDGPFPEAKEFLAGFWIVEVDSPERACEIAARASAAPGDERSADGRLTTASLKSAATPAVGVSAAGARRVSGPGPDIRPRGPAATGGDGVREEHERSFSRRECPGSPHPPFPIY
jgi:hypothetical protein